MAAMAETPHRPNILSTSRAQRRRLHDRLAAWIADTDDRFALPNPQP